MASAIYLLLNGTEYELPAEPVVDDGQPILSLSHLDGLIAAVAKGDGQPLTVSIKRGEDIAGLVIAKVDSYAVWSVERPAPAGFAPTRIR